MTPCEYHVCRFFEVWRPLCIETALDRCPAAQAPVVLVRSGKPCLEERPRHPSACEDVRLRCGLPGTVVEMTGYVVTASRVIHVFARQSRSNTL
jgi:hypothetical protein